MIRSCKDRDTERVWRREPTKKLSPSLRRAALRKLLVLDGAETLDDVRSPPGNRLEKLTSNRKGQHSMRINDQWRICFPWEHGDAYDVEITDYH